MSLRVLCETYLCISITEDIAETPKQWFKKAIVCASESWLDQKAANLTQKGTRGEKKLLQDSGRELIKPKTAGLITKASQIIKRPKQ